MKKLSLIILLAIITSTFVFGCTGYRKMVQENIPISIVSKKEKAPPVKKVEKVEEKDKDKDKRKKKRKSRKRRKGFRGFRFKR